MGASPVDELEKAVYANATPEELAQALAQMTPAQIAHFEQLVAATKGKQPASTTTPAGPPPPVK